MTDSGNYQDQINRLWEVGAMQTGALLGIIGGCFGFLWRYASSRSKGLWVRLDKDANDGKNLAISHVLMFATKEDIKRLEGRIDLNEKNLNDMLMEQRRDIDVKHQELRKDIAEMIAKRPPIQGANARKHRERNLDITDEIEKNDPGD